MRHSSPPRSQTRLLYMGKHSPATGFSLHGKEAILRQRSPGGSGLSCRATGDSRRRKPGITLSPQGSLAPGQSQAGEGLRTAGQQKPFSSFYHRVDLEPHIRFATGLHKHINPPVGQRLRWSGQKEHSRCPPPLLMRCSKPSWAHT